MSSYHLTPSARQDVLGIYDHIAADNPDAADRLVDELYHAHHEPLEILAVAHAARDIPTLLRHL